MRKRKDEIKRGKEMTERRDKRKKRKEMTERRDEKNKREEKRKGDILSKIKGKRRGSMLIWGNFCIFFDIDGRILGKLSNFAAIRISFDVITKIRSFLPLLLIHYFIV